MSSHIPKMMMRKLVSHLRQTPLLTESLSDESGADEEPDRCRKRCKMLKSAKVRTADSTVVKRVAWPHELMYTSGGEPAVYKHLLMPHIRVWICGCVGYS